jgi:carboxypeptidase Taq
MTPYERLKSSFARMATIGEAQAMLGWDAAAVMPPGGGAARGEQLAVLAGLSHELMIDPKVAERLAEAEVNPPSDPWDRANLSLMRHAHTRATALPGDLVEAQARANSACEKIWRVARTDSDFAMVAPALAEVVALTRQSADALGPALGMAPYDALMDGYQRGVASADVEPIFARYEAFLAHALPLAEARQAALPTALPLVGTFPAELQEGLGRYLAERAGLDFEHARLDRSLHPFCGGTPTDVRMTTRYDDSNPAAALLGVLHETGHALYEQGLPNGYARQPVGEAAGMAAHESQSLIIEMQACRSSNFLTWLGVELHRVFGGEVAVFDGANLQRLWRRVERGFIRVDADEMTYPAHIILRFTLEKALIAGDLKVRELPGAWNDGLFALLGIRPPNDALGCLQDIHWYDGAFGYFPSYSLGAMAAAQLMATARQEVQGLDDKLGRGDLGPLVQWLRLRVHGSGSRFGFNDLLASATGDALDPHHFEEHLTRRYLSAG